MKARPPKPDPQKADAFIAGADAAPKPAGKSTAKAAPKYPWEAASVRPDVQKPFLVRLPEPLALKLAYIREQSGKSQHSVCLRAIEAEVDRELKALNK